jgi:hypothetical protein
MRMAAIYARVSSDQQREANTIASQSASLIEFAKNQDLEVPKEWVCGGATFGDRSEAASAGYRSWSSACRLHAGIFFDTAGAAASCAFVGGYGAYGFHVIAPLIIAGFTVASWAPRPPYHRRPEIKQKLQRVSEDVLRNPGD